MKLSYKTIYQALKTMSELGDVKGTAFANWLLTALPKLSEIVAENEKAYAEASQAAAFQAYIEAQKVLAKDFVTTGENGQVEPLSEEKEAELKVALETLRKDEKYAAAVELFQSELAKLQEKIKSEAEEIEVDITAFPKAELPNDLTANQILQLSKLLA